jgi:TIR domain
MRKQTTQQIAPKIYISHSASDNILAHKIRNLLKSGFNANIFMNEDLSGGEEWEPQLRRALSDSDYVVVLLTPQSIRSTFVLLDLGAAWGLGKPIICIVTQRNLWHTVTVPLNESQIIEVTDIDAPASSDELTRRFSQIMESHPV